MTITALIADTTAKGITLLANGDTLGVVAPPGVVTPAIRATLIAHKPDLLAVLSRLEGMRRNPSPVPTAKSAAESPGGPGHCFSCGDPHDHPRAYGRCVACTYASDLFYQERHVDEIPATF